MKMNYSKALYTVDNTGEAIENRHSFDMIVNMLENDKKEKKGRTCRMCETGFCAEWCINKGVK